MPNSNRPRLDMAILGKDGESLIPIKVDSAGRLVLAADVQLGDVDIGEVTVNNTPEEAVPVSVQGSDENPVNVTLLGHLPAMLHGTNQFRVYEQRSMDPQTLEEFFTTAGSPVWIDDFEFACSSRTTGQLRIYAGPTTNQSALLLRIINPDGASEIGSYLTMGELAERKHPMFRFLVFDANEGLYKIAMTGMPRFFPEGITITMYNTASTTPLNASLQITGRGWE